MAHLPVLAEPATDAWIGAGRGVFVDATFGGGGHSALGLARLAPDAVLYCADRDPQAVQRARSLAQEDARVRPLHCDFAQLDGALDAGHLGSVQGVLMDLGISSVQLDDPARGFSFQAEGPLDMRMDTSGGPTAGDWLAQASSGQMETAFRDYGGERQARRLAEAIVAARGEGKLPASTRQLAQLVQSHKRGSDGQLHPATRVFLALRVVVNREVQQLQQGLAAAARLLRTGGRLVVISFQSLEDRVVKAFFRPPPQPDLPRHVPVPPRAAGADAAQSHGWRECLRAMPDAAEKRANPRARSAVMRVGEKLA